MLHLLTAHGTLAFVDPDSGLLRHGPIGQVPANLVAIRDDDGLLLRHRHDDATLHPIALGATLCGAAVTTPAPRHLAERPRAPLRTTLSADGHFLGAGPDGTMSFTATVALDWETFMLLSPAAYEDLRTLLTNRWVTASGPRVLPPEECVARPDFAVRIRQTDFDLETLLAALRPPGAAPLAERGEIALRYEGWRLDRLHLFRPLACLTVFGAEAEFACAMITVGSLLQFGGWTGDFLLITDPAHADFASRLPPEIAARVHVVPLETDDAMDRAFARYRVPALPAAQGYQPIICFEHNVICDAPLDPLLLGLATSERLHLLPEGRLLDAADSYGRSLFLRDGYADQGEAIGFTTGLLGFRSVRDVRRPFSDILACGYGFAEQEQSRNFFTTLDQAFANYVMQKIAVFDLSLLHAAMSTPGAGGTRRGLVRVLAPPGETASRLAGMRGYLDTLTSQQS